jgi:capsular polysaccharide biosynthesis protein
MGGAVDTSAFEPTPSRLFVSRRDTGKRRIRNEGEVIEALETYGFERVVPGEHSLAEQVAWFAGADAVVGPHGGGLTNTIYGQDLTVVEIFGDSIRPHYYDIAMVSGFDYGIVRGTPVDGVDIRVDVSELTETLESVGIDPV